MKKKILSALLLAVCVIVPLVAMAEASPCEHNFVYQYREQEYVHYRCSKCSAEYDKSIVALMRAWSNSVVNTAVNNDTFYFDLVDDDFINAKDYAKIRNEYKKFKRTPDIDDGGGF